MERLNRLSALAATFVACLLPACNSRPAPKADKVIAPTQQDLSLEASPTVERSGRPNGKDTSVGGGKLKISYADVGDALAIRTVSEQPVVLHVDFNQNGSVDRSTDRSYGLKDDQTSCVQFEHERGESADCGEAPTAEKHELTVLSDVRDVYWRIPKSELSAGGKTAWISFELYDPAEERSTFFPDGPLFQQTYKLAYGRSAIYQNTGPAGPAPVAKAPSVRAPQETKPRTKGDEPKLAPSTQVSDAAQGPTIAFFNAEPPIVNKGDSVRLAWSVSNAQTVQIDQGIGGVNPVGEVIVRPTKTETFNLEADGGAGQPVRKSQTVEVRQPVEITRFEAVSSVVNLDGNIELRWETNAAIRVSLKLRTGAPGARFEYPETNVSARGSVTVPVARDQFTRYGDYVFELDADGLLGPISKIVTIHVRQKF
jgi:hypothetical protein